MEEHIISHENDLRALLPKMHPLAGEKCIDQLDIHSKKFISLSPFLCIGTQSSNGKADVSPRGDPAGFVKVLDDKTILVPDRPGNNRLDTMTNILANGSIGLLFLIPGFDETMRINGTARITKDPELLKLMTVKDREPSVAILVQITEVFIHCAKAFRRSKLWENDQHQERSTMPSIAQIILDQTSGIPELEEMAKIDADIEEEYKTSLY